MNTAAASPKKRSETRQKGRVLSIRVSDGERQEVEAFAAREGLTTGSYVRSRILATPTTRAIRRPVPEVQKLSKVLAELGRMSSNLNQLAKRANSGDMPFAGDIRDTLAACRQIAEQAKDVLDGNT